MNQEMAEAVYAQAMNLWINPDILERHARGEVELPVVLTAAQIIFGIDGSHKVRINGEVKGTLIAKYKRDMKVGEFITFNDIEDLHVAERDPDDEDFGHITLISQGNDGWNISFSFLYGVDNVKNYLSLGREYLEGAKQALQTSQKIAISLGMTAGENLLKARLATSPLIQVRSKTHSKLINLLGQFSQLSNTKKIDPEYNKAIKFFFKHFNGVRYEPNYQKIHKSTIMKNLRTLERLDAETQTLINQVDVHSLEQRQIKIANK